MWSLVVLYQVMNLQTCSGAAAILTCGHHPKLACDLVDVAISMIIIADANYQTISARSCSSDMVKLTVSAMMAIPCFPLKTQWHDTSGKASATVKSSSCSHACVFDALGLCLARSAAANRLP